MSNNADIVSGDWFPLHCALRSYGSTQPHCGECAYCLANAEIVRLRAELIRTAEVIAAQTFDTKTISKTRMKQLVRLSRELLMIADGGQPIRYYHERTITSDTVRQQYPQLRDALASPDAWQEARRER